MLSILPQPICLQSTSIAPIAPPPGYAPVLSLHEESRKDDLFGKFCDCLVRHYKNRMLESHRRSAKHRSSVSEIESSQAFLKDAMYQILQTSYFCFISTEYLFDF